MDVFRKYVAFSGFTILCIEIEVTFFAEIESMLKLQFE